MPWEAAFFYPIGEIFGLEFRTVHWLFADKLSNYHKDEDYYTVVTRAKTSIDVYYTTSLPAVLAGAHAEDGVLPW